MSDPILALDLPLNPHERDELAGLLERHHTQDSLEMIGLDGFLHALPCLPRMPHPTLWLEAAVPEALMGNQTQAEQVLHLVLRQHNAVLRHLLSARIEPLCDGSLPQTRQWLEGFARAFALDPEGLLRLSEREATRPDQPAPISALLMALSLGPAQTRETLAEAADLLEARDAVYTLLEEQSEASRLELIESVALTVYGLLEPERARFRPEGQYDSKGQLRRGTPKVGRNDPCPCGSGKKYKHCHGT